MNETRTDPNDTNKAGANIFFGLANGVGSPLRDILAKRGTVGERELQSSSRLWGLLALFVIAAGTRSEALLVVFGLWLTANLLHRRKRSRGHTRYIGDPPAGSGPAGWFGVGLLALFAAPFVDDMDHGLGVWLAVSSVGHLLSLGLSGSMERSRDMDMEDAQIEAECRSARQERRR